MDQTYPNKQLSCSKHKFSSLDCIHLTGQTDQGRICIFCVAQNSIPFEEILSIQELFQEKKEDLLSTYPPFQSQQIKELIETYSKENLQKESIYEFFKQLRLDVEKAIQIAENKAKQQLIKLIQGKKVLIQEINKIAEVDKLKEHLISGSNENLNEFLKQKWRDAKKNSQIIQTIINQNQIPLFHFNLKEKQKEISPLISSIKNFTFFQEQQQQQQQRQLKANKFENSIINTSNLIKSLHQNSSKLTISKTVNGSLQLINNNSTNFCGQAFLDFVLKPKLSYTIKLNYQPKGNESSFFFGIVSDQNKDSIWSGHISKMNYHNKNSNLGISRYLKGPNINSHQRRNQKEEFEVKIFLEQKVMQVASLPGYGSILELDDPNKINSQISYRFWMFIFYPGDMIEINEILESNKYEQFKI